MGIRTVPAVQYKYCDRCGDESERDSAGEAELFSRKAVVREVERDDNLVASTPVVKDHELCDTCMGSFKRWIAADV